MRTENEKALKKDRAVLKKGCISELLNMHLPRCIAGEVNTGRPVNKFVHSDALARG